MNLSRFLWLVYWSVSIQVWHHSRKSSDLIDWLRTPSPRDRPLPPFPSESHPRFITHRPSCNICLSSRTWFPDSIDSPETRCLGRSLVTKDLVREVEVGTDFGRKGIPVEGRSLGWVVLPTVTPKIRPNSEVTRKETPWNHNPTSSAGPDPLPLSHILTELLRQQYHVRPSLELGSIHHLSFYLSHSLHQSPFWTWRRILSDHTHLVILETPGRTLRSLVQVMVDKLVPTGKVGRLGVKRMYNEHLYWFEWSDASMLLFLCYGYIITLRGGCLWCSLVVCHQLNFGYSNFGQKWKYMGKHRRKFTRRDNRRILKYNKSYYQVSR